MVISGRLSQPLRFKKNTIILTQAGAKARERKAQKNRNKWKKSSK
jgi:hypothetical protein